MPYMYDKPAGHDNGQTYSESEIELLKLLNAGGPTSMAPRSEYAQAQSYGDQSDALHEDADDDFVIERRYPRMSFNGRAYPPVPPDASSLPRPVDDWFNNEEQIPASQTYDSALAPFPSDSHFGGDSIYAQADVRAAADMDPYFPGETYGLSHTIPHHSGWTPPRGWPMMSAAPLLHPRLVQLPDRPITPHDTYRYPASHHENIYIAPAAPSAETVNHAFAVWYCGQVINLLVTPGQFRPGVGGASDELWGPSGREKEGWERVGRAAPDYSKCWGRMGMPTLVPAPRKVSRRRPELEPRDPWNVEWTNLTQPSATLVTFVSDIIQRMTISPSALVAAVWFLAGLGLHEGDGHKGSKLRSFLRECHSLEMEAVERRIAALGLMLAGKWLDDNSFLIKSWHEVTTIPIKQLDRMERHALEDLHYSLYVPVSSWADHVNTLYTSLVSKMLPDDIDLVVTPLIDQMVTDARETELREPVPSAPASDFHRRLSTDELPAAADQAISRDWGTFVRPYTHVRNDLDSHGEDDHARHYRAGSMDEDEELERAEKCVDALVNDMDEDGGEDEEEEEFLDYDGATQWLPPIVQGRRSTSSSRERSRSSPFEEPYHHTNSHSVMSYGALPAPEIETYDMPQRLPTTDWASTVAVTSPYVTRACDMYAVPMTSKYDFSPCYVECKTIHRGSKRSPLGDRSVNHQSANTNTNTNFNMHGRASTDYDESSYLEPGVSVVHPPAPAPADSHYTRSNDSFSKRYRYSDSNENQVITQAIDESVYIDPYTYSLKPRYHSQVTAAGYY